jgi:hypothetical protein
MPTYVHTKQSFIEFIQKVIEDDKVIVVSNEMSGSLTASKKNGTKIQHVFAPSCFKDEGVGHIAFGKSHPLGIVVADESRLSDHSKKLIAEYKFKTTTP